MAGIAMVMAMPIAHVIAMECLTVGYSMLATCREAAMISIMRVEVVVDVPIEIIMAVVPRTRADENAAVKPLRAVVAVGSTVVWSVVIVAVRASRLDTDADANADLGLGCWSRREAEYRDSD
jgi:hypothetical protein